MTPKQLVVYCNEPSHTSESVGMFVTDPDPYHVLLEVFVIAAFSYNDETGWHNGLYGRHIRKRGGKEYATKDGRAVRFRDTKLERLAERLDKRFADIPEGIGSTHQRYRLRCDRCGLELRRNADFDDVFDRLAANGVTGVSLRALIAGP